MLPSEMVILLAVLIGKDASRKLLERPMDVTGEYMGYLNDSLVKRGYLRRRRAGFTLTDSGRQAIAGFLRKQGLKASAAADKLRQIGIEVTEEHRQKIDKLLREAAGTG